MTFETADGRLLQRSLLHVTANIHHAAQTEGSVKGNDLYACMDTDQQFNTPDIHISVL